MSVHLYLKNTLNCWNSTLLVDMLCLSEGKKKKRTPEEGVIVPLQVATSLAATQT